MSHFKAKNTKFDSGWKPPVAYIGHTVSETNKQY